jgi:hypothetical protein
MSTNDPEEFIGTDRSVKADPKPNLTAERTIPAPVYVKKATGSHAKHAIKAPRLAYEAAVIETQSARVELQQAQDALRIASHAEGARVAEWVALNKPPDALSVTRAYLQREAEMRMANVANGRPVNDRGGPIVGSDPSPLGQAALNRGKHAGGNAQKAGTPLRSNIARHVV